MAIELLFFTLAGCVFGVFTGLVPGIHANTVAAIALAVLQTGRLELVALIVGMSIVHTFVDFIPSVLLAVPGEDNALSVLPGHRLFLKGKGHYAVMLTVWGGLLGGIMAIAVSPVLLKFLQQNIEGISRAVPIVLTLVLGLMVFSEKGTKKKFFATAIIVLSALLGIISLSGASSIKNPLPALILGFFGAGPLLYSMEKKSVVKEQKTGKTVFRQKTVLDGAMLSVLGASFVSMFPGIGPNQAALIIRTIVGKIRTSTYLVIIGGINTANMFFSLIALYAVGKTRTGTAAAIKQLVELQPEHMLLLAGVCLIAIGFGAMATSSISKRLLHRLSRANYKRINQAVLAIIITLAFLFSNSLGLLAMATASAISFSAVSLGVKRSNCMAFLMVPTILLYNVF